MLREFSVRLRTTNGKRDYHFIVPVRAGTPEQAGGYAIRFIEEFYEVKVTDHIVRYKGRALPTWAEKAQRVVPAKSGKARRVVKYRQQRRAA